MARVYVGRKQKRPLRAVSPWACAIHGARRARRPGEEASGVASVNPGHLAPTLQHIARPDTTMGHVGDGRWREVFLLTAGMLDDATEFCTLFVAALNQMVAGEDEIGQLLQWGVVKSRQVLGAAKPPALRAFYLYIFALARALAFARDRDLALDLQKTIRNVIETSQKMGLTALAEAVEQLAVPDVAAPREAWQQFYHQLQQLSIQQRDIGHEWPLSLAQTELYMRYLEATELFVDCLQLATLPNRETFENQLLLPPNAG